MATHKLTLEQIKAIPKELELLTREELATKYAVHVNSINRWVRELRKRGLLEIEITDHRGGVSILDK
jgi:transposase